MYKPLEIGVIGLDSSHCTLYTELWNNEEHPHHIPGVRVKTAFAGGSPDIPSSYSRVGTYTAELSDRFGVRMMDSIEELAEQSDAIMINSNDGRVHLEQFSRIAPFGKPVYINKPLALDVRTATAMFELADRYSVALLSCSALRYADPLTEFLRRDLPLLGAECWSPMSLEPTNPGWFWYGIHAAEMLYTIMPTGCKQVQAFTSSTSDYAVGTWADGRTGAIRGNRADNHSYGATVHHGQDTVVIPVLQSNRPFYAALLEQMVHMFRTGQSPLDPSITLELIRFLEAANESRITGRTVQL
jgi:predicted dehydrogenase